MSDNKLYSLTLIHHTDIICCGGHRGLPIFCGLVREASIRLVVDYLINYFSICCGSVVQPVVHHNVQQNHNKSKLMQFVRKARSGEQSQWIGFAARTCLEPETGSPAAVAHSAACSAVAGHRDRSSAQHKQ